MAALWACSVWVSQAGPLVPNPGFEEGANGWHFAAPPGAPSRVEVVTRSPHAGRHALLMDATALPGEVGAWSGLIPVRGGVRYRFGVWVKQTAGYSQYKAVIEWRSAEGKHLSYANNWRGNDWPVEYTLHGGEFVAPPEATHAILLIGVAAGSACLMDDFALDPLPPVGPRLRAYLVCEPPGDELRDPSWPVGVVGWTKPAGALARRVVKAWVRNQGDSPSAACGLTLQCPPGMVTKEPRRDLHALGPGERVRVEWSVAGEPRQTEAEMRAEVVGGGKVEGSLRTTVFVTEARDGREARTTRGVGGDGRDAHPTGPLVGAYYFPVMLDWDHHDWGLRKVDYLKPLLGYYDEALPEVAEWHIDWAADHGIDFFAFDWYYNDGARFIDDALDKGFLKARNRDRMKFCIFWCNEGQCTWDRPINYSIESLTELAKHWAARYLRRPECLRVDGRPVVMIIHPDPIIEWHGGAEGSRKALDAMREVARKHGVPDLYFMCVGLAERSRLYKAAGYDAITAYSYGWGAAPRYENRDADYDDLIVEHDAAWKASLASARGGGLDYMPVVWTGWDDYPRAREKAVRTRNVTPGTFREMCRLAGRYVDPKLNMVILEAWNEWGEGSYLEPSLQRGFGMLDAVRDAFTNLRGPRTDPVPTAEQVAQYEARTTLAEMEADYIGRDRARQQVAILTEPRWEFDAPGDFKGWHNRWQVTDVDVVGGALRATSTTDDPAFLGPPLMAVDASTWPVLGLRMRTTGGSTGQLFWTTEHGEPLTEATSVKFPLVADGEWHTYRLPVGESPHWHGTIRQLRLDPVDVAGARFELAWIEGRPM